MTEAVEIDDSATGVGAKNWSWAIAQDWCGGAGTYGDPFLIENSTVTISSGDFGISIIDSNSTTYFRINNVTVVNTDASGSGILLNNTYNGQILESICNSMADSGIKAITAVNTTITGNTLNLNAYGLYMDNVSLATISTNTIINNTNSGIYGANCTYNTIGNTNNLTDNNNYGIYMINSDENDINQNGIRSGNETGIAIVDSDNCTVYYNTISGNTDYGITITEDDGNSLNNTIYRNDFDDNGINGVDNCSIANSWDNGSLGNDWDDYKAKYPETGLDADDDGIGDVAYTVPGSAGAKDNYPIYDDGVEPTASLSSDDDYDDLFEDELNLATIDWTLIAGLSVLTIGCGIGLYFLVKTKMIKPNKIKARVKPRIKTAKRKVKSKARIKRRR